MNFEEFETAIEGLGDGEKNTALEVRNILKNVLQSIFLPGDVKLVNCTQTEIASDYTSTGLGRGKRSGWAICNGLNGTAPYNGRFPIGYGDGYPEMGAMGGSKDAVVVEHSHDTVGFGTSGSGNDGLASNNFKWGNFGKTSVAGTSGKDKNLPPYLVQLFIQKL